MIVFETFLEQDGPQDAKTGDEGEQFRMSERQRVRGTAIASFFLRVARKSCLKYSYAAVYTEAPIP